MLIYIPSRGRAGAARTYQGLSPVAQARAVHVVPPSEVPEYRERGLPAIPCPAVGIGPVRQWIIERHHRAARKNSGTGNSLLMLDDDLYFAKRSRDDLTKFVAITQRSMDQMLAAVVNLSMKYAHGGISAREGANRETQMVTFNNRNLRALFYNARILMTNKVRFDRLPVMEDFDVALQLLELGYASAKVNSWVQDQRMSNAPGGCSLYRTPEVQAAGAYGLARFHPDSVTVVEKPPMKSGTWNGQPRIDVRVQWKKAYETRSPVRSTD